MPLTWTRRLFALGLLATLASSEAATAPPPPSSLYLNSSCHQDDAEWTRGSASDIANRIRGWMDREGRKGTPSFCQKIHCAIGIRSTIFNKIVLLRPIKLSRCPYIWWHTSQTAQIVLYVKIVVMQLAFSLLYSYLSSVDIPNNNFPALAAPFPSSIPI